MTLKNFFISAAILILLAGCGNAIKRDAPRSMKTPARPGAELTDSRLAKKKLYSQYKEWKGVRYRFGGLSKRGIDCSGLVYLTFKSKFGLKLPRTTKMQANIGKSVKKGSLKAGDLVFFKTSYKVRHVGIYLEKGRFMHASKKKGVMISKLKEPYWSSKYWKARRIER